MDYTLNKKHQKRVLSALVQTDGMELTMRTYELTAPCHMGLEAVLKREILDLGYDISRVENGKVTYVGDAEAICRSNVFLRSAERVLLSVARFKAVTFTELFDKTKAVAWEEFIPANGKFWVKKANSVNSKLFSSSDIQSIIKKAIVERLKEKHNIEWFPEDGEEYPIRVNILKDEVTIGLDTTGDSLHKRGYRPIAGKAPISECLASAIIMLTPYKAGRLFLDPFCGSGTFPIEAAMLAANVAPGMNRKFTAQSWTNIIPKKEWQGVIEEAKDLVDVSLLKSKDEPLICGCDIDAQMIKTAKDNAKRAGVEKMIRWEISDVCNMSSDGKYGFIVTNPPYGERLEEKSALPDLYSSFGRQFEKMDTWSAYIITSYEDTQKYFGRKSDKNRKIYNGMLKTYLYQYFGAKPPKA